MDALAREIGEWLTLVPSYTLFNSQLLRAFPDDKTVPLSRGERIAKFAHEYGWHVGISDIGCTFMKAEG